MRFLKFSIDLGIMIVCAGLRAEPSIKEQFADRRSRVKDVWEMVDLARCENRRSNQYICISCSTGRSGTCWWCWGRRGNDQLEQIRPMLVGTETGMGELAGHDLNR